MNTNNTISSSIAASDVGASDIAAPVSPPRLRGWLPRLLAMLAPHATVQSHACNAFRQQNDGSFVCQECGEVFGDAGDLPP